MLRIVPTLQRGNVALGAPAPSTRRSGAVLVPTPERGNDHV